MRIEVTTFDRGATFELLGTTSASRNQEVDLGNEVTAVFAGTLMRKAVGFPEVVEFGIAVGAGTIANVAANAIWAWLTSSLKTRPERVTIDRIEVEFDEGAVKKLVVDRLTLDRDGR